MQSFLETKRIREGYRWREELRNSLGSDLGMGVFRELIVHKSSSRRRKGVKDSRDT